MERWVPWAKFMYENSYNFSSMLQRIPLKVPCYKVELPETGTECKNGSVFEEVIVVS